MNLDRKQALVTGLSERLGGARAVYLTDFAGLNVKAMTALRAKLRREGVQYLVVKNSLAVRAIEGLPLADVADSFRGPTGLVIAGEDPIAPARLLAEFARDHNDRPVVKAGVVEQRAVGPADVKRLATLPPREQQLAELAGALESPMAQFAWALQAKLTELAGLIEALRGARAA